MAAPSGQRLRLAELIAALSLATDLGMGQPMAHALRTCLWALGLGRVLGARDRELADTFYTTLLRFVGCTADAHELLDFAAGDDVGFRQALAGVANGTPDEVAPHLVGFLTSAGVTGDVAAHVREAIGSRTGVAAQSMTAHCEVASMLASRLGLGRSACDALRHGFERWDGHGFPEGKAGEEIPLAVRLAVAARDVEVISRSRGLDAAAATMKQRRGRAHDPGIVDAFLAHGRAILQEIDHGDPWDAVLDREPGGPVWVSGPQIDTTLTVFADYADVKTPFTLGHSRGVASLADRAARALGFAPDDVDRVRRAGLLHDLGRTGIPNAVWEKPGPLTNDQWERVRLHPYYTERMLSCCAFLRPLAATSGAHHERLDGSGYHKGSRARDLDRPARLLAAADACQAMLQPRPHRPARPLEDVARQLGDDVSAGRLDPSSVDAVLAAAGSRPRHMAHRLPGGLTAREGEVLCLMAQGRSNRDIGVALTITPKTVGHHIQHIYDKLGFSTRAAAAIFAVEHGLLPTGADPVER